jgi:membrane protease YdiL (CAAX protease family)
MITGETVTVPDQLSPGLSTRARVLAGIFAIVIAPVVEELFFRGILFRSLRYRGFWPAALVSSVVFGSVHYVGGPAANALFLMIATACTGLGLAAIYEWRGLATSIGAHVTFNAIGVVVIFTLA